ncbi:glycosyltransferase [Leptolyngbya sp. GGD]|uniref:glycosyltransferase n=1 Tax=Leptolyngbya sp. GGD TaxID=2997907 RepID=UPI00227B71BF|nr:glycosyltransferase [Leptolyngbya sp. GGD]MCY6494521.1 glycosyltransferase [Leptolyngbya sp. GGD]
MRAALLCDYPEEQWHSMDLCAQMLLSHWRMDRRWQLDPIRPPFHHRVARLPKLRGRKVAFNSDRLLNRFWDYPNYVKRLASQFDIFHVCDHSYAQLVHELPAERTGVYCHDIDAFRSLIDPGQEPRPGWYRAMSQRILDGLQKAAIVFYSTASVRQQLEHYQLVDPNRLIQASYGISPEFSPIETAPSLFPELADFPFILHVGSCIPRKRIDVLLDVFAQLRDRHPNLRLVKVGGDWTSEQNEQLDRLEIRSRLIQFHNLSTHEIAALYRRSAAVLVTSQAEGFGLPVIESLACGAIAVVSDLPVLREVGGEAAIYCPVGEIATWVETVDAVLVGQRTPEKSLRLAQASRYSWQTHTKAITQAYLQLGAR